MPIYYTLLHINAYKRVHSFVIFIISSIPLSVKYSFKGYFLQSKQRVIGRSISSRPSMDNILIKQNHRVNSGMTPSLFFPSKKNNKRTNENRSAVKYTTLGDGYESVHYE